MENWTEGGVWGQIESLHKGQGGGGRGSRDFTDHQRASRKMPRVRVHDVFKLALTTCGLSSTFMLFVSDEENIFGMLLNCAFCDE